MRGTLFLEFGEVLRAITERTALAGYSDRALLRLATGDLDVELRVESAQHLREIADRLVELADEWDSR